MLASVPRSAVPFLARPSSIDTALDRLAARPRGAGRARISAMLTVGTTGPADETPVRFATRGSRPTSRDACLPAQAVPAAGHHKITLQTSTAALPARPTQSQHGAPSAAQPSKPVRRRQPPLPSLPSQAARRSLIGAKIPGGVGALVTRVLPETCQFHPPLTIAHLQGLFAGAVDRFEKQVITIGSSLRADITLLDDGVADRHVTIEMIPGLTRPQVFFSATVGGVFVNGRAPQPLETTARRRLVLAGDHEGRAAIVVTGQLQSGDQISIGEAVLQVSWPSAFQSMVGRH